jgi:hypothetical protein
MLRLSKHGVGFFRGLLTRSDALSDSNGRLEYRPGGRCFFI